MKKFITFMLALCCISMAAQSAKENGRRGVLQRRCQMVVQLNDSAAIAKQNRELTRSIADNNEKSLLLASLAKGFGSALVQKTQNASSNLISTSINYLVEALKSDKKKWYSTAKSHCTLSMKLKSETQINDFYSAPSSQGAMDPHNIQFKGFGCHHFLEEVGSKGVGKEVFYVFCKLRTDETGINSIVNHSKFMVEIDSLMFIPKYCGLPNDTLDVLQPFDFHKRDNLTLNIKARLYSSWINEAIMVTNDQLLGEFTISAKVDPAKLTVVNGDSAFVYRKGDPEFERLVSVTGDCFMVPRSFTGTNNGTSYTPTWGTGQYRIEMDVTETCRIVDQYYYKQKYLNETIAIRESGNGAQIARAGIPEYKKFDKAKWKVEWTPLKKRQRKATYWKSAWQGIVTAYKGSGWVQTFTDPLTNVILNYEGQKLNELLNLSGSATPASAKSGSASGAAAGSKTSGTGTKPSTGGAGAGTPSGNRPN